MATSYIPRNKALKKLQLSLPDFRSVQSPVSFPISHTDQKLIPRLHSVFTWRSLSPASTRSETCYLGLGTQRIITVTMAFFCSS